MKAVKPKKITNSSGLELEVMNYGATILSLMVPNKHGSKTNVAVSLEKPIDYTKSSYINKKLFLGASIGRYAGRISEGKFKIDEVVYPIPNTEGVHLHGGTEGFDKKYWEFDNCDDNNSSISLSYLSKDGEEGYPGNLKVTVTYELRSNSLRITYKATTDKPTPVNLTNHNYFNLNGKGSILDHQIEVMSSKHLELKKDLTPTGKMIDSMHTKFDLRTKASIGKSDFNGFDDVFVLGENELIKATLSCLDSGIKMEVITNQSSMVIFTPREFPDMKFKNNVEYYDFPAICFETQNYPDAPNNSHFPNSILQPEEEYINKTTFKFRSIS